MPLLLRTSNGDLRAIFHPVEGGTAALVCVGGAMGGMDGPADGVYRRLPELLAQWLLYGYVVSRLLHFVAYFTGQIHDIRAACWTVGSLILIFMTVRTLLAASMEKVRTATIDVSKTYTNEFIHRP